MTTPDPQQTNEASKKTMQVLIEAFTKLPPLLSYGGLILVAGIFILSLSDVLPDQLLWTPLVAIAAFLIYTYINRYFDLQERKIEVKPSQPTEPAPAKPDDAPPSPQVQPEPPKADTAATQNDAPDADEWLRRYLHHLIKLCGYPPSMALIDIREAGVSAQKVGLEKIFTTLDVPNQRLGRPDAHNYSEKELQAMSDKQRESALAALSRAENDRLVLLGAPGSGKSTLVNYLTLCLAGDQLRSKQFNQDHLREMGWELSRFALLPVRIVLREYAARGLLRKQSVWQFIVAELSRESVALTGFVPQLQKRLAKEGGILLLDGLDEVDKATELRQRLKENIELFARDFPKVRLVVTSRPYAYGSGWELTNFQVTRLLPFSEAQIEAFITQWYTVMGQQDGTLGPEKAKSYQEGLVGQVKRNVNLHELAQHPLLLTMMVYIHRGREGGALPQRREELYELSVALLLDLWRRSKAVAGQETQTLAEVLGLHLEELKTALAEVAFAAHRDQKGQEQTADIPGALLAGTLYKHASNKEVSVAQIIEYVRDRAGLLEAHGLNADGSDDVYRFPHRTFQEYLAGLHLLRQNFPYDLARLARHDPGRWRECLLLAASSSRKTTPFLVWSLLNVLCEEEAAPPATADPQAQWGAFLAGQTLLETELTAPTAPQSGSEKASRQRIWQWQKQLVTAGLLPPPERALAGHALAALGDDRPGVQRSDEMPLCLVPPGPFWLGSWERGQQGAWYDGLNRPYWLAQLPVTTAQFKEFVADSGFKPSRQQYSLSGAGNLPVAYVNWYDALAFCDWLDKQWRGAGWLPDGYRVTLPSEVEWEKAARGGRQIPQTAQIVVPSQLAAGLGILPTLAENPLPQRQYPWGDDPAQAELASGEALFRENNKAAGIGERCVVGAFPAGDSPVGCLELSGQVWEWTRSLHEKPWPYQQTKAYETISSSNKESMVLRGGAYYNDQNGCSARFGYVPHISLSNDRGFRVCVSPFTAGL